jgi:hypothetical protein
MDPESGRKPWWVLVNVCKALGIGNNRDVAAKLDDDEKDAVDIADAIGRMQRTTIVNRPGLTKVLRDSKKPEAKAAADRFDRWLRHDVLEEIFETGSYAAPGAHRRSTQRQSLPPSPPPKLPGEAESADADDPRDMTVFNPFLRPVGGQQKAWSNSLRAAQESGKPHKQVLPLFRKLMSDLPPEIVRQNLRPTNYTDSLGRSQPMIEFCQDVLSNVLAAVGGPKFHIVLYLLQQAFDHLLATVRSGGASSGRDAATIAAAVTSAFAPVFRQQTEMIREGFVLLRDQIANLGGGSSHVVRHDSMYDDLNGSRVYDHDP